MNKRRKLIAIAIAAIVVIAAAGTAFALTQKTTDFGEIVINDIPKKSSEATRILSYNLRCANDEEGSVNDRSQLVCAVIEQYLPDSFGVQEATPKWLKKLDGKLGDKYDRVGEARDRNIFGSEYSCVYYLKDKYNLIDSGTIWLSETPEVKYSQSFDTACTRIATWAVLENKETGVRYTHINTHLDHVLESTRVAQADVLIEKIKELQKEGTIVCTGDFNTDCSSDVYKEMLKIVDDSRLLAKDTDDGITYHNYGKIEDEPGGAIDFAFVTKDTKVDTYKIIRNTVNSMYPSDHYAVCADIYLK